MTQQQSFEKVKEIVKEDLEGHFKDRFVFDPIVVEPAVDEFGDGTGETYLNILIVFDGDQDGLDPAWTAGLIGRISENSLRPTSRNSHAPLSSRNPSGSAGSRLSRNRA